MELGVINTLAVGKAPQKTKQTSRCALCRDTNSQPLSFSPATKTGLLVNTLRHLFVANPPRDRAVAIVGVANYRYATVLNSL